MKFEHIRAHTYPETLPYTSLYCEGIEGGKRRPLYFGLAEIEQIFFVR